MRILLLCFSIFLTGCASKVNIISSDLQVNLPSKMGYVLLPIYSNTSIFELRVSGSKYFKFDISDLRYKKNYLLIQLPEGKYSYSEIRLKKYTVINDFKSSLWDFTVKRGVINYVGDFNLTNHSKTYNTYNLTYEIHNNSSVALEYLEKEYPQITQSHQVVYGGPGEDDFFSYVDSISINKGDK